MLSLVKASVASLLFVAASASDAHGEAIPAKTPKELISKADRHFRDDQPEQAIRLYSEALALPGQTNAALSKIYYARQKVHVKQKKYPYAISDLSSAIEMDPAYTVAYLQRANMELTAGRCAEAVTDYETVLRMDSGKRDAIARLPAARACAASLERAEYAERIGDWHTVREMVAAAMEPDKASFAPGLLLRRAMASFRLNDVDQTLADTSRVLKMEPNSLQGYELRAWSLLRLGDYTPARNHYQQCLKVDPDHKPCKDGYRAMKAVLKAQAQGEAAMGQGRWQDAVEALTEGLNADQTNPTWRKEVLPKLAKAYLKLKNAAQALEFAEASVNEDDNCAACHCIKGEALILLEKWDDAVRHTRRAHELDRNNGEYQDAVRRAEAALRQSKNKDYYKVLGVARDADDRSIKKAYRGLAMEWHPDKHSGKSSLEEAEGKFRDIAEAYEILSDAEKRGKYDRGEPVDGQQQGQPGGGGGHPFGHPHGFPFGGGGGFTFQFRQG